MLQQLQNSRVLRPAQNIAPADGEVFYIEAFVEPVEASLFFQQLLEEQAWKEEEISIAGKKLKVPRMVCWHGDPEAVYTYSGAAHFPLRWTPVLTKLKTRIENHTHRPFNSVLGNLYRNGQDAMGWHADKEKELGKNPFIASLSLGEKRLFKLRHNKSKETIDIELENGSLLLMGGALQHHWRHCIPKTRAKKEARINLTFRKIIVDASQ